MTAKTLDNISNSSIPTNTTTTHKSLTNTNRPPFNYKLPKNHPITKKLRDKYPNINHDAMLAYKVGGFEKLDIFGWIEIVICSTFLFLPRFLLLIFSSLSLNLVGLLATIGLDRNKSPVKPDMTGLRYLLTIPMLFLYRLMGLSLGVWWIKPVGKRLSIKQAPISVIAPHSTITDTFFLGRLPFFDRASPVSSSDYTFINGPIRVLLPIMVSIRNSKSRKSLIYEMKRRVEQTCLNWHQLAIFPEGTMANSNVILDFKPGAFLPSVNVQPIFIKLKPSRDLCCFTYLHNNLANCILGHLLTFKTSFEIHYLNVYQPSTEEKQDPYLYAYNVRNVISKYSNLPTLDVTIEDGRFIEYFSKNGGNEIYGFPKYLHLYKNYGARLKDCTKCLDRYINTFHSIMDTETGEILLESYAKFLNVSVSNLEKYYFQNLSIYRINHRLPEGQRPDTPKVVTIQTMLEAHFRAKENVSICEIEKLDLTKVVKQAKIIDKLRKKSDDVNFDEILKLPREQICDFLFDYLQEDSFYMAFRCMEIE